MPNIFIIFVLSQVVVMVVIVVVLKQILNGKLNDLAIKQLESGQLVWDGPNASVVVTTHRPLSSPQRERILRVMKRDETSPIVPEFRINKKILGGMIIQAGSQTVDYSLIDRLRKAR